MQLLLPLPLLLYLLQACCSCCDAILTCVRMIMPHRFADTRLLSLLLLLLPYNRPAAAAAA
jgi:hypothetical protein